MALDNIALNKTSTGGGKTNISTIHDAVNSLTKAVSVLQSLEHLERNMMFKDLELEFPKKGVDFNQAVRLFEISLIQQALRQTDGHQTKAAKLLRLKTSTLNSIVKRHSIDF